MASCIQCGAGFNAVRPTARYCGSKCRVAASRARAAAGGAPAAAVGARSMPNITALPPRPAVDDDQTVRAATLQALSELDRQDTPLGRTALALAGRLDAGIDTGSAMAAAAKQLEATLTAATAGAESSASAMDRLRAARNAKRGA